MTMSNNCHEGIMTNLYETFNNYMQQTGKSKLRKDMKLCAIHVSNVHIMCKVVSSRGL